MTKKSNEQLKKESEEKNGEFKKSFEAQTQNYQKKLMN